jgi:hypothetical protein
MAFGLQAHDAVEGAVQIAPHHFSYPMVGGPLVDLRENGESPRKTLWCLPRRSLTSTRRLEKSAARFVSSICLEAGPHRIRFFLARAVKAHALAVIGAALGLAMDIWALLRKSAMLAD